MNRTAKLLAIFAILSVGSCASTECKTKTLGSRDKYSPCNVHGSLKKGYQNSYDRTHLITFQSTRNECVTKCAVSPVCSSLLYDTVQKTCALNTNLIRERNIQKDVGNDIISSYQCWIRTGDCDFENPSFEHYTNHDGFPWAISVSDKPYGGAFSVVKDPSAPKGDYVGNATLVGSKPVVQLEQTIWLERKTNYTVTFAYNLVSSQTNPEVSDLKYELFSYGDGVGLLDSFTIDASEAGMGWQTHTTKRFQLYQLLGSPHGEEGYQLVVQPAPPFKGTYNAVVLVDNFRLNKVT